MADPAAHATGELVLFGPDSSGHFAGSLGPLSNLTVPALDVPLFGRTEDGWVNELVKSDGYVVNGAACNTVPPFCFGVAFELYPLSPPAGAIVYLDARGFGDAPVGCSSTPLLGAITPVP
jgi:hypothetical protein